jgi:hypothetical protein
VQYCVYCIKLQTYLLVLKLYRYRLSGQGRSEWLRKLITAYYQLRDHDLVKVLNCAGDRLINKPPSSSLPPQQTATLPHSLVPRYLLFRRAGCTDKYRAVFTVKTTDTTREPEASIVSGFFDSCLYFIQTV